MPHNESIMPVELHSCCSVVYISNISYVLKFKEAVL